MLSSLPYPIYQTLTPTHWKETVGFQSIQVGRRAVKGNLSVAKTCRGGIIEVDN